MKKRILIITTLVFAVLGAGVAVAAYTSGTYSGRTTSQRGPISFKASQSRLTQLKVGVVWNCTDGDRFQSDLRGFPGQNIVRGNYNASFTGSNGASRYTNRGRLSRVRIGPRLVNQAKGTFTGRRLYNTNDQLDPNGTITCTTGSLAYTIRRTGR
jgi:hypothetical protein